jgi:hypothetical protein
MSNKWIQLWVQAKDRITTDPIALMKRCDSMLQRFGAVPCAPDGVPVRSADGTIEVRVYSESMVGIVKGYLSDSGFEVVREQVND